MTDEAGVISGIAAGRERNSLVEWLARIVGLAWLLGPIFDKELRVSSRRRRNYVLRFLYVAFFALLVILIWANEVAHSTSSVYQASRMAQAGLRVIAAVVWFQFMAAQVIAIVMLSTSISDEIYHRTLGTLMTTPIGSVQIVLGKLLSKSLQLLLLLGITLPLLAVVRVFGGVPWEYLACGLCVTVTTILFVGSLSLLFSIFTRRAYVAIITTILTTGLLFGLLPLIAGFLVHKITPAVGFFRSLQYVNPYIVMITAIEALGTAASMRLVHWRAHCGIMLGATSLVLLFAMILVRRAALRQAIGQTGLWSGKRASKAADNVEKAARTRRVAGPPVLWKERRTPLLGRRRTPMVAAILLAIGLLITTYAICLSEDVLTDSGVHTVYVVVLVLLGMLFATILPATCIASEKESGTWPLLLTTTVSDWAILSGKLLGALRRGFPAWLFLFGHMVLFTLAGLVHPLGVVQLAILVAWVSLFLCGTGLYFSACFKHTTTAVIANVALAAGLWAIFPLLMGITMAILGVHENLLEVYMDMNPVVHAIVITNATARNGSLGGYDWIQGGLTDATQATGWILFNFLLYVVIGFVFLVRAKARLRRNLL